MNKYSEHNSRTNSQRDTEFDNQSVYDGESD